MGGSGILHMVPGGNCAWAVSTLGPVACPVHTRALPCHLQSLHTGLFLAYSLHPWGAKPRPTVSWERAQGFCPWSLWLLWPVKGLSLSPFPSPLPPSLHPGKLRHLQPSQATLSDPLELVLSNFGQRQIWALTSGSGNIYAACTIQLVPESTAAH